MTQWKLAALVSAAAVVGLSVGCGVAPPGLEENATAAEVVDASSAAMRELSSFAFVSESGQEGGAPFESMVIAAEWAGKENHKATVKPPYNDNVIEVIVAEGAGYSRWLGEAWAEQLSVDLTGIDWAAVPDVTAPRLLADEVVDSVPVYHVVGTTMSTTVDRDVTRTVESQVDLYISKQDLLMLRRTSRARIVSVVGATASDEDRDYVQISERTFSRFNEAFEITAPIVPNPTPLPTRTPRPLSVNSSPQRITRRGRLG